MNEQEWPECCDPKAILELIRGTVSARKARLLGVAFARRVWNRMDDEIRRAIEVAELFADGELSESKLRAANRLAAQLSRSFMQRHDESFRLALIGAWATDEFPLVAASQTAAEMEWIDQGSRPTRAALCRDIFGNPFRSVRIDPVWLTPSVTALAQAIYDERRSTDIPLLTDALAEAGCDNADMLDHCRQPGEHVRGCWLVDLVLGKE